MESTILFEIRRRKGFRQEQVAEKLGISRQMYSLYEKDVRNIKIVTLIKIFDAIGATDEERKEFCNKIARL